MPVLFPLPTKGLKDGGYSLNQIMEPSNLKLE